MTSPDDAHHHPDSPEPHAHARGPAPHTHTIRVLDRSAPARTVTLTDTAHWADGTSETVRTWTCGLDDPGEPAQTGPAGHPTPEGLARAGHDIVSFDQVAGCDDPDVLLKVLAACRAPVPDPGGCVACAATARHSAMLAAPAPGDDALVGPACDRCGLPTCRNPHPGAGQPDAGAGSVWECVPCLRRALDAALAENVWLAARLDPPFAP